MILTEIVVVICATTGGPCTNYVEVVSGVLSVVGCERTIQEFARDHTPAGAVLRRERSSCALMPVSSQNDLAT
jgi:hypothetical protein